MDIYDEPRSKSKCSRFCGCVLKIISCIFTHFILVTMVVSYCFLGAVMFESLEKENEAFVKKNITYMRNNVSEDLWMYTKNLMVLHEGNWTDHAIERIRQFENDLVVAVRKSGWDGIEDPNVLQWTFTGALFYSIIVITTIGYGHIAPKTPWGKVATIFYAIVGIPLMLLCLSNIGDIMANSFRFLYWKVCCFACTRTNKRRNSTRRSRSVRSNGGRQLSRSRTASLRGRTSQRSADSAINMSEINSGNYPETTDQSIRTVKEEERGKSQSNQRMHLPQNDTSSAGPVLCNIYAFDPDDVFRGKQRSATLPPRGVEREDSLRSKVTSGKWTNKNTLSVDNNLSLQPKLRSTPDLSSRHEYSRNPSPSIMSPMGFIVPRARADYSTYSEYDDSSPPDQTKPVPIWLCVLLVVSYIIGGAFLFSDWEDWHIADSAYFCFITLTTIGFGDFVPAQRVNKKNGEISIALCSLYLLFGIALLAMSFNLVQEEVINNVKAVAKHLGILKDDSQDESEFDE